MPASSRRTCVGCRRRAHPDELVRVVADAGDRLRRDATAPGRGAWVCPDVACVLAAGRRNGFARALRRSVSPEAITALGEEMAARPGMMGSKSSSSRDPR